MIDKSGGGAGLAGRPRGRTRTTGRPALAVGGLFSYQEASR